jgi:hypothetical protein
LSASSIDDAFAPAALEFLREAQYSVIPDEDGIAVVGDDFESRYVLHRGPSGVLEVARHERAAAARPRIEGTALIDVERWLMLVLRSDVRRRRGVLSPPIGPPDDRAAPGFTGAEDAGDVVVSDGRGPRLRFHRVSRTDRTWVRWTHVADRPLAEVAERLTSATGW